MRQMLGGDKEEDKRKREKGRCSKLVYEDLYPEDAGKFVKERIYNKSRLCIGNCADNNSPSPWADVAAVAQLVQLWSEE